MIVFQEAILSLKRASDFTLFVFHWFNFEFIAFQNKKPMAVFTCVQFWCSWHTIQLVQKSQKRIQTNFSNLWFRLYCFPSKGRGLFERLIVKKIKKKQILQWRYPYILILKKNWCSFQKFQNRYEIFTILQNIQPSWENTKSMVVNMEIWVSVDLDRIIWTSQFKYIIENWLIATYRSSRIFIFILPSRQAVTKSSYFILLRIFVKLGQFICLSLTIFDGTFWRQVLSPFKFKLLNFGQKQNHAQQLQLSFADIIVSQYHLYNLGSDFVLTLLYFFDVFEQDCRCLNLQKTQITIKEK
eukprot:TRINITY_DN6506_c0_g2_i10.p1 TRINITY_DN6506_c0_g2~~TRINITY_DN6506_c0_g2_i10.p1  ORF type:complete len:298 (-),score=0.39 TRINITY_DN6506_c0_g2_i10:365-1258(-)